MSEGAKVVGGGSVLPFAILGPSEDDALWSLILADTYSPAEVFEAFGHTGSGYSWDSIARVAMREAPASQLEGLTFDSEAGTFVVMSEDEQVIRSLGVKLCALLHDEAALRIAIAAVPEDDWDD